MNSECILDSIRENLFMFDCVCVCVFVCMYAAVYLYESWIVFPIAIHVWEYVDVI